MGQKRSVSLSPGPTQNRGITQRLHLSDTPGIIPIGINHTIICQPIGLYLSYGYRNIITCTGRNSPWTGVFRVQLSRRSDRVGHQLTFLPHHADVVNGACCTMYNKQDHLRRAVKGSFFVSIFVDKCRFYVDKCRFYLK